MALNPYAGRPYSEHHAAGTWTAADYSLPAKGDYDECYKALCSELPVLPTVGLVALVEEVCREENAQGKTLEKQIHDLVNKQVLGRAGVEVLHKLRIVGNKFVHEMKRHDTRVLGTAFNGVEHLLLGVYILPEESEKTK